MNIKHEVWSYSYAYNTGMFTQSRSISPRQRSYGSCVIRHTPCLHVGIHIGRRHLKIIIMSIYIYIYVFIPYTIEIHFKQILI